MPEVNPTNSLINDEIPDWKIKLSQFYVEHKVVIKRFLVFMLFFGDILIVFLFGSTLLNYQTGIISDQDFMRSMPVNLINHQDIAANMKPDDLHIGASYIIPAGDGRYDLMAMIENKNKKWMATEIEYSFLVDGEKLELRNSFILPMSKKPLVYFNADRNGTVKLEMENIKWKRVDDYSLISHKDDFEIESAEFIPIGAGVSFGQAEIVLTNKSPFSLWELGLAVVVYDQFSRPAALNYAVINKFMYQEERELKISWANKILGSGFRIEVYPEVDFTTDDAVMDIEAGPGSPSGIDY